MSSDQRVLFLKEVNGELEWFKEGDKYKDRKYEGEIRNLKPNGQGTFTSSRDGVKYEGEWKDGLPNGKGTKTNRDGDKYEGEWKENKNWNTTVYSKKGNYFGRYVNGERK